MLRQHLSQEHDRASRCFHLIDEQVAPLELEYLDGTGTLRFDELRGQIVVVNFWASWCLPCRAEHGHLTAANDAYRERGVQFVGVVL